VRSEYYRFCSGKFLNYSDHREAGLELLYIVGTVHLSRQGQAALHHITIPSFDTFDTTVMSSKQTSLPHYGVPDVEIESLLGQGRSYDEWKVRLKNHGYGGLWNENLKNIIIKREFEKFKTEILRLQAEPNEAPSGKDIQKTNSLESILKRLQGQDWANGKPNEKLQRVRDRRLLGKDAK
jgi:hypothetical protein